MGSMFIIHVMEACNKDYYNSHENEQIGAKSVMKEESAILVTTSGSMCCLSSSSSSSSPSSSYTSV